MTDSKDVTAKEMFMNRVNDRIRSFAGKTWNDIVAESLIADFDITESQAIFYVEKWKEENDAS